MDTQENKPLYSIAELAYFEGQDYLLDEFGVAYSKDGKKLLAYRENRLENYAVREGTEVICERAFYRCDHLTAIVLPKSLTVIGRNAFRDCPCLKSVNLPEGLLSIGANAFARCDSLLKIALPESLREITNNAFGTHSDLQITNKSPFFKIENNLLIQGTTAIALVGKPDYLKVPDYVRSFRNFTLAYFTGHVIEFPVGLASTQRTTFYDGFKQLERIYIDCPPDANEPLVIKKFKSLIPNGLHKYMRVKGCPSTYVSEEDLKEATTDEYGVSYSKDGKRLLRCKLDYDNPTPWEYTVREGTQAICRNAFWQKKIKSYNKHPFIYEPFTLIPSTGLLTTITLPDSLLSIGENAFSNCWSLTKIRILCAEASDEAAVRAKFKRMLTKGMFRRIEIIKQ
ncbi:MAG: leucine-rich repeat domain-containing protein [Prevotellaceae bacterium]|nr:leucine-rich repeat domain-containing protein [Prevotellaceae bacterium]